MASFSNSSDAEFGPASSREFDFTLLFQDTILTILPATIFLIAAGFRAVWLTSSPNKVATSLSHSTKLVCFSQASKPQANTFQVLLSAFAAVQLTVLLARATNLEVATRASVAAAALDFTAACVLFVLSCFEHGRSVTPSTVIGIYMLVSLPFDAVRLRTFYLLRNSAAQGIANLLSLALAVKFGVLVTEAVEKRGILLEPYRHLPPEATSGVYSRSVFWWLNPLLRLGFGKNLKTDDLFGLDQALSSDSVRSRFRRKWASVKEHSRFSLIWVTIDVLKWQLLLAALPRLLLVGVKFAQPFLIESTISYVSNRDEQPASTGWGLVGAFFLTYFSTAILTASYQHLLNRAITQLRGGLISLIYQQTLEISTGTIDPTSSLTLMSSDVQKVAEVSTYLHDTWSSIIEVGVSMFLLYRKLGTACYGPAIVYIIQIVGTIWITKVIPAYQKRWLEAVQLRVNFTSALLHSMRNVKLLGLSSVIEGRTQGLRDFEVSECKRYRIVNNFMIIIQNGAVTFAPFATFLIFYIRSQTSGQPLDLATSFSVLTILRIVGTPLAILLYSCPAMAGCSACFERIQVYILADVRQDNRLSLDSVYDSNEYWDDQPRQENSIEMRRLGSVSRSPGDEILSLKNCSFGWERSGSPVINDLDLSVQSDTISMIIGVTGCGKSTLLKGMLSETPLSQGFVYLRNKSIAFCDQEPWVQNGTIKAAICGPSSWDFSPADDRWYREVLSCCGLTEDVENFPHGNKTVIGSRGVSLSGGQKQRLALARAVYARTDILILDDVFSGLDNDTEELIFKRLFGRSGPVRRTKTTVIMVTHAVHRLPYADQIVCLDATGRISEQGNYLSLINSRGYVHSLDVRYKQQQNITQDEEEAITVEAPRQNKVDKETNAITEEENSQRDLNRRTGEWATYKHWFRSCGYLSSLFSVVWSIVFVLMGQMPGILVQLFSSNKDGASEGASARSRSFIIIFGASTAIAGLSLAGACIQVFMYMQPRSSRGLHLNLLQTVLNAPLSFFTRTDIGTIINRFSQDMTLVDGELPFSYIDFILSFVQAASGIALVGASGGYFAAVIPVVLGAMYFVQKYYLRTSRQIRLLDLEEKAPLYTLFGETAAGLASVRAFGWEEKFEQRNIELLDRSQRPFYLMFCIQQWLGIVLELLVTVMVTILLVIVVIRRASISPGLVGLGLLSTVTLSSSLAQVVRLWTQLETSIGAISRLRDFVAFTASEHQSWEVEEVRKTWPETGEVFFSKFAASYSDDSALVLDNINLKVRLGEKVGVCGRSGSGKSSALASLFHLLEYRSGNIWIDGVDISTIPRETLRANLNVIPQEPWWVSTASVRFNMDPWNATHTDFATPLDRDAMFVSALSRCQIWHVINEKGGLDAIMTSDFLSHGQRQLFCLARAMVRNSKLVVLDEVSASVDVKTDELMQQVIREHFEDCTVISVAHRLNTIAYGDRVVVLSKGKVVEVGEPGTLLKMQGSWFKDLYEA